MSGECGMRPFLLVVWNTSGGCCEALNAICVARESDTALNRRLEISIRALRSRRSLGAELTRDVIAEGERSVRRGTTEGTKTPWEATGLIPHSAWVNLENVLPGLLLWK